MDMAEKKKQEIGEKIVKSVQKHLADRYPSMMMVIYNLIPIYDPKEEKMSTDGKYLFFSPDFLIASFKDKKNRVKLEKMYMHILLHCMYGHVAGREKKDTEAYDLLVDLNVVMAMGGLEEKGIRTPAKLMRSREMQFIRKMWKDKLTEEMYEDMMEHPEAKKLIESLSEFTVQDNHTYWNQMNPVAKEAEEKNRKNEEEKNGSQNGGKSGGKKGEKSSGQDAAYQKKIGAQWKQMRNMFLGQNMIDKNMRGLMAGTLSGEEKERYGMAKENHCSYKEFLRRFVENQEVMKIDEDSFDYIWYHIGTEHYKNMPILEPLEYKDDKVCDNFVIAIDTSGSCCGDVAERFLRETWNLFRDMSTQNRRFEIYLMQCDTEVVYEKELHTEEDIPDFNDMDLYGFGGTDFRPVFRRIEELRESGKLSKINGLIYFSDGYGTFPKKVTDYETVFVLPFEGEWMEDDDFESNLPSWITKIRLTEDDLKLE